MILNFRLLPNPRHFKYLNFYFYFFTGFLHDKLNSKIKTLSAAHIQCHEIQVLKKGNLQSDHNIKYSFFFDCRMEKTW